jgi:hypothetical protein
MICRCRYALAAALHADQFKREVGSVRYIRLATDIRIVAFDSCRIEQKATRKGLHCLRLLRWAKSGQGLTGGQPCKPPGHRRALAGCQK